MLRKFAAVLIAATMLTAPALAQGTAPTPSAPAMRSSKVSAAKPDAKIVKVTKHKKVKKAGIHRHAKHVKHVRHARHGRHHIKHASVKRTHAIKATTGHGTHSAPMKATN